MGSGALAMACAISISASPDDIWMIQNAIFAEFAALTVQQYANDEDVVSEIQLADAMNGVSLDILYRNQPAIAMRLRLAFQMIAEEIAEGRVEPSLGRLQSREVRDSFAKLVQLLRRFHPEARAK